jgi:putative N-acetylmannosamine-6-phosphate epimerase
MARPVSSATQVVRVGVDCVLVGGALDTAKVHLPSVFSASVR